MDQRPQLKLVCRSISAYYPVFSALRSAMCEDPQLNRIRRRRMRYAERKLREAQLRLARTERSILHWSRKLADLKYETTCAIQPTLWPQETTKEKN